MDSNLFQDIEREGGEETDGLSDPLSSLSHVRSADLLWVSVMVMVMSWDVSCVQLAWAIIKRKKMPSKNDF